MKLYQDFFLQSHKSTRALKIMCQMHAKENLSFISEHHFDLLNYLSLLSCCRCFPYLDANSLAYQMFNFISNSSK